MTLLIENPTSFSPLPPLKSKSVTVVIPAFNEEGNLEPLLLLIDQAFKALDFTLPVLIIDDGSTDDSPNILALLSRKYPFLKVIRHPHRRSVTGVLKTALAYTTTDWIFWGQADLESDPQTDLPLLLEACVPGVDAVAGWRQQRNDGKTFASNLANSTCRRMFGLGIHDMNWIKLVRRDVLATLPLELVTHRYTLAVMAGWGCRVVEVPTPWHPRHSGKSKFGRGRLISSAIDFFKVWCWFQSEGRVLTPMKLERLGWLTKR